MRGLSLMPWMLQFGIRTGLKLLVLLVAVAVLSFVLIERSPIDPVGAYIGADMMLIGPEQRQMIAERWGLDQPATTRFLRWLWQLAQGNLGTSSIFNQPVAQVIASRFAASFNLMFLTWVLLGLFGLGLGILA
ncbi:MAG: ABC transporter permease, partial [Cyanophyceae cyanobacterium]